MVLTTRMPAWRLEDVPPEKVSTVDLLIDSNLDALLDTIRPRTRFSTASPTAATRSRLIASSSTGPISILSPDCSRGLESRSIACYVHAGQLVRIW